MERRSPSACDSQYMIHQRDMRTYDCFCEVLLVKVCIYYGEVRVLSPMECDLVHDLYTSLADFCVSQTIGQASSGRERLTNSSTREYFAVCRQRRTSQSHPLQDRYWPVEGHLQRGSYGIYIWIISSSPQTG